MSERGPIVCATDLGTTGARAVDLAARMARATGRVLRIVHVGPPGPDVLPEDLVSEADRVLRERLKTRIEASAAALEKERARVEASGAQVEAELLEGRPWEQIIECATRVGASLVVVGPHGARGPLALRRGELTEHVLGTTADWVVRHAPCPVLVGPREGSGPDRVHGGRWLVAVDFSATSRAALRVAHELAGVCEAQLVPLHVVPEMLTSAAPDPADPLRMKEAAASAAGREHAAELTRLVADELGEEVEVKVALGAPADTLALATEHLSTDLVIMGTRGRTGLAHLVLGSVAERTLRRSPVPVLCVRPER